MRKIKEMRIATHSLSLCANRNEKEKKKRKRNNSDSVLSVLYKLRMQKPFRDESPEPHFMVDHLARKSQVTFI